MEKIKQEDSHQIYEESDSFNPSQAVQAHQKKKKIKKINKKKEKRALVKPSREEIPYIHQFVSQNPTLFAQNKTVLAQKYRAAIVSTCHIQQILSASEDFVFNIQQADCQQETWRHMTFLKALQQSTYQKLGICSNIGAFSVGLLRHENDDNSPISPRKVQFLTTIEDNLYQRRLIAREKVRQYVNQFALSLGYTQNQMTDPKLEILALSKINKELEHEIMQKITSVLEREYMNDNYFPSDERTASNLQNKYIRKIILKNLQRAFSETPIDFLHYHKQIQLYEDNGFVETQLEVTWTLEDFIQYKNKLKPNKKPGRKYMLKVSSMDEKPLKNSLRTPCVACFSDFAQLSNPILNCPECTMRIHLHCQRVQQRCHRCRFGRTSNEEKSKTGFCYICQRPREKGLMVVTVNNTSPHYYAHNFCLLLHDYWQIDKGEFKGHHNIVNQSETPCKLCKRAGGILISCCKCGERMHGMCAYLNGMSFRMQRRNDGSEQYAVHIDCCNEQSLSERLSMERRFKLNYEKVVFRENKQLFDYISRRIANQEK